MEKLEFIIRFITPAFLGNADQQGQWRSPPFKALLREWWRIVAAFNLLRNGSSPKTLHQEIRNEEGLLFGHAWLEYPRQEKKTWAMKGRVRFRLSNWECGGLNAIESITGSKMICHKEVDLSRLPDNIRRRYYCEEHKSYHKVDPLVYLGFGPHTTKGIKNKPAIGPDESVKWQLLISPSVKTHNISQSLNLIHWFGTVGGRSRNGWGSVSIENANTDSLRLTSVDALICGEAASNLMNFSRPLEDCLQLDWPHALGKSANGRLLIWKSRNSFPNWSQAMQELARVKISFRTALPVPAGHAGDRHILAYPVTNHKVRDWFEHGKDTNRLANQLRFKVVQDKNKRCWALAYHLPCGLPKMLQERLQNKIGLDKQRNIWTKVHDILDKEMYRIPRGGQS